MFKMHGAAFQKRAGTLTAQAALGHAKMRTYGRAEFDGN